MENKTVKQSVKNAVKKKDELSSTERYNIILKMYKGLFDNLEELYK